MNFLNKIKSFFAKKFKQPISNTALLLTITICTFIAMYVFAMIVWGGGFLNIQQFFNIFITCYIIRCYICQIWYLGSTDRNIF